MAHKSCKCEAPGESLDLSQNAEKHPATTQTALTRSCRGQKSLWLRICANWTANQPTHRSAGWKRWKHQMPSGKAPPIPRIGFHKETAKLTGIQAAGSRQLSNDKKRSNELVPVNTRNFSIRHLNRAPLVGRKRLTPFAIVGGTAENRHDDEILAAQNVGP
jgi:hypothetical protein